MKLCVMRNAYKAMIGKQRKRTLRRRTYRWEIRLAQDTVLWQASVGTVMSLRVP